MEKYNDELMHYGVPGMKWGVRKARYTPTSGSGKRDRSNAIKILEKGRKASKSVKTFTKNANAKHKEKKAIKKQKEANKKKTVKDMSDAELSQAIRRLEMEKRYNELSPKKVSKGKTFTKRVMNNMVVPAAEDVGKQMIKSALVKEANNKVISRMVSNNPNMNFNDYKIYTNNQKKK